MTEDEVMYGVPFHVAFGMIPTPLGPHWQLISAGIPRYARMGVANFRTITGHVVPVVYIELAHGTWTLHSVDPVELRQEMADAIGLDWARDDSTLYAQAEMAHHHWCVRLDAAAKASARSGAN